MALYFLICTRLLIKWETFPLGPARGAIAGQVIHHQASITRLRRQTACHCRGEEQRGLGVLRDSN